MPRGKSSLSRLVPAVLLVLLGAGILLAIVLGGCQPRVPIDHDADPATPAIPMDEAAIQRWETTTAKRAAEREAKARATAASIVRRAQREAAADVEDTIAQAETDLGDELARSAERVDTVHAIAEDGLARIEEQRSFAERAMGVVTGPAGQTLAGLIPGAGPLVLAGLGVLGGHWNASRAARKADAAWDEARKEQAGDSNAALVKALLAAIQPGAVLPAAPAVPPKEAA